MIDPTLLGSLSTLHGLLMQLAERIPEQILNRAIHPEHGSLAHTLGMTIYRELYWLREVIQADDDLSKRVEHLFLPGALPLQQQCEQMPPKDHLLNWGTEIQDHHMMLLANPGMLPEHPLLEDDAIIHFIAQEHAQGYEKMLSLLMLQQLKGLDLGYTTNNVLESRLPVREVVDITQGVYRIGARQDPRAYDNELPPQMVELSKFAIAKRPVSNAEYLAFMEDGGYNRPELWPADAGAWLQAEANGAPLHWRKDQKGRCYGIGLNGAFELASDDPVYGVNQHEASAFAAWTAQLSDQTAGAVLQHEYQWEVATRTQAISEYGRVWEWCANTFEPYSEYQPPARNHLATQEFDGQHKVLRGASLHSQPVLRRLSFRNRAHPHSNIHFSGIRLVFPPSKDFWLP